MKSNKTRQDKYFRNYPKTLPRTIHSHKFKTLVLFINAWANLTSFPNKNQSFVDNRISEYGLGYKQAVSDVFDKIRELTSNTKKT